MTVDRKKFLGGSDAAAVLGISPYRTPLDLYLDKIEPRVETEERNLAAKTRGKRLEPYICDMLQSEYGVQLAARNQRYVDAEHPFLACEVDAETPDQVNVEIKTVHPFKVKEWGEEMTDSIPVHYTAQAMHGLMVTGRDRCVFAVLIGDDLRIYNVERDPVTIAALREREVAFWHQHVLARVPPAPATATDLLRLFDKDAGTAIEITPEAADALNRLKHARAQIEEWQACADANELLVKSFMGDAATLTFEGKVVATWKTQSTRRFDQKAFGSEHPDLLEKFKRASESRVFRVK